MQRYPTRPRVAGAHALMVALALLATLAPAQTRAVADSFTAFAVNLDSTTPLATGAGQVEFVVDRYSTESETNRLMTTLLEKGPEQLLDELQDLPRIGYIRTPGSLAYDLRFARKVRDEEGGDRITIMTDRYITVWEAANRPRTIDYPFTVIELRLNRDGEGEGKLSLFTKIEADKRNNTIVLENYGTQPVLLKNVRRTARSE
jgi:hypothetical protein